MFDLEAETDRLVLCQAAILFISWSSSKHYKDAFYWIGNAISSAYSVKLQQPESHASLPDDVQRLRSRIWWTLVVREADVCLTMGRPPRIWPGRMPLLRQDFFVDGVRTTDYSSGPDVGKFCRDPWVQNRLEQAFIEKAKLALIIYRILRLPRADSEVSAGRANREARIWLLEAELKDWRHQLPVDMTSPNPALNLFDDADRSLHLNASMINLTDRMATVILHKSQVSVIEWIDGPQDDDGWCDDAPAVETLAHLKSMRQAASDITTIHKTLHDQALTSASPTIGVATICAAVYVHLLDARSPTATKREASLKQLDICLDVLQELGQINDTAQDVTRLVQAAVQAARDGCPFFSNGHKQAPTGERREEPDADEQLPCSTHSYMEGVVLHAQTPHHTSTLPPVESADNLDPTSQYFFLGMESLFDFDWCGTPLSLPNEAWQ